MGLVLVDGPEDEPLTSDELATHVRELDSAQQPYLADLGVVAREQVELWCRRSLLTQTWRLVLDEFPSDKAFIRLPRPPLQSITSVKYIDAGGVQQTWDPTNYLVDTASLPGRLCLAYYKSWPLTQCRPNTVEITYVAGYGDADDVPEGIKHGIRLWVGNLYEHREPVITGTIATKMPLSVEALLGPYRVLEY